MIAGMQGVIILLLIGKRRGALLRDHLAILILPARDLHIDGLIRAHITCLLWRDGEGVGVSAMQKMSK